MINKISSMMSSASLNYHSGLLGTISKEPISPKHSAEVNSKYLLLQGKLSNLQSELTREQTKLNLLQNESNLSLLNQEFIYEDKPLFDMPNEELIENKVDLIKEIQARKLELAREIQKIESVSIEMQDTDFGSTIEEMKQESLPEININSKKVEKLIKE